LTQRQGQAQVTDVPVDVPDVGAIQVDIAWGGNFYAIVQAAAVGLDLGEPRVGRRIMLAEAIRDAINSATESGTRCWTA
jgi:proline racemase